MFEVKTTKQFVKGYKRSIKRNLDIILLDELIKSLAKSGTVPAINKPHQLTGNLKGLMECHIKPDWLLIWDIDHKEKEVLLIATGSHSDLFR